MKTSIVPRLILSVFLAMLCAAPLSAQWGITAASVNGGTNIAYSFADIEVAVSVTVRSLNPSSSFFFTIDGGGTSELYPRRSYRGADWVDYNIYQDSTYQDIILPVTEPITIANVVSGVTAANRRRTVTIPLLVPEAQSGTNFPTGNYASTLTIRLYTGTYAAWVAGGGTAPAIATRNITVTIALANNFVRVFVVQDGGSWEEGTANATLDFGTLTTGLIRSMDVLVKSYPRNWYTLRFHSANGGALAPVIPGPPNIPYTFYYEGAVHSLAADYTSPQYPDMDATDYDPDVYDIDFEIGTVDPVNQLPGEYSDIITITLTAVW